MPERRCAVCHRFIGELAECTPMGLKIKDTVVQLLVCSTCLAVPPKEGGHFGHS